MEKRKTVFFYGLPGAGKGTQANLLVNTMGFWHFDSGKFIEHFVHDPARQNDAIVQRERALFDGGSLNTPEWILEIVREKAEKMLVSADIVFSGSARTLFEAFGDERNKGLIESLSLISDVYIFWLDVEDAAAIQRNCARVICSTCSTPFINFEGLKYPACPLCGSLLKKRILDNPETMKKRLQEYRLRTAPVIEKIGLSDLAVHKIDANLSPQEVHFQVLEILKA
jgi:adenylate kinase